jgi:hypothetical protein
VKWFTTFGAVEIGEQLLRLSRRGAQLRPFCLAAGVRPQGYSRPLQRVLADFGAEASFQAATLRVKEHYGVLIPISALREQTLRHGRAITALADPQKAKAAAQLITEMDGSLIPVMTPGGGADRRKGKTLFWREVKLCCARPAGSVQTRYGATLGNATTAGWLWQEVARSAGLSPQTRVHGLGDGARWIMDQFTSLFGEQGTYLVDFYHTSGYLAAAQTQVCPGQAKPWLHRQQERLLNNQLNKVLRTLRSHQESEATEETPVRAAYRYLSERADHLDYQAARQNDLPIGSGEIESAHRHVVQQRLKLSGCWWKEPNAGAMLNLRVARANDLWSAYWSPAHN